MANVDVLEGLRSALPHEDVPAVQKCMEQLYEALPDQKNLSANTVMVAYGGGKDSAYATAFVRAVHLAMAEAKQGATFKLRVVTMRHSGMPYSVMENIDRTFSSLGLYEDPDAEVLLIERDRIRSFSRNLPMPFDLVAQNRLDMLMGGHRTGGDGRSTFCTTCNLNVANSFGVAATYDGGVDLIITGDSPSEQRDYAKWVRGLARSASVKPAASRKGFKGFLETLDGLAETYHSEVHGAANEDRLAARRVESSIDEAVRFFSIYDHTSYASGEHWDLLTNYLGFEFDELAFNFTESDCANPLLMAHLRGLRTERVYETDYLEGIGQYVDFAVDLMARKDFPDHLIEMIRKRYDSVEGIQNMRAAAERYAEETLGLGTPQLVCMVYSPFAGRGKNLKNYLEVEVPALAERVDEIHDGLSGRASLSLEVVTQLEQLSGLALSDLRALYAGPLWHTATPTESSLSEIVMKGDPHQRVIEQSTKAGVVSDRVSGR